MEGARGRGVAGYVPMTWGRIRRRCVPEAVSVGEGFPGCIPNSQPSACARGLEGGKEDGGNFWGEPGPNLR